MSEQPKSLSEISHLFLSSVRGKAQGSSRPMRMPPQTRTDMTIDLTPEEFAHVFGENQKTDESAPPIGPIRSVLAAHLGSQQLARTREYAARIAAGGNRVGLIAVDASEFRLSIFEKNAPAQSISAEHPETDQLDARKMTQALEELAWDVDQWLILLPTPRVPEARSLLRDISHWTALTSCDHESVVACYRTLKGLSDLNRPRLSVATLDDSNEDEAAGARQRLSSVCRQFLDWSLEIDSIASSSDDVSEHLVLWCSATRDKGQMASAPQWQVVADFLANAKKRPMPAPHHEPTAVAAKQPVATAVAAPQPAPTAPVMSPVPMQNIASDIPQILDLPDAQDTSTAIISAVLRGGHDLVECPVKAPMCEEASLAVSRDNRLVLLAVARAGLNDLQMIGRAYQWMIENRSLIAMAVPQMSIDAHQLPTLHLLVDHADMSAQVLQPILQAASVKVHTYRKLRWGAKTGLLLEAA